MYMYVCVCVYICILEYINLYLYIRTELGELDPIVQLPHETSLFDVATTMVRHNAHRYVCRSVVVTYMYIRIYLY